MSIFTEQEAKAILDKVCKLSKADECTAQLTGSRRRQRALRAEQRLDQRHRQQHRSRRAGRVRQARRHRDDQRVRRRLARESRAPRRRARAARARKSRSSCRRSTSRPTSRATPSSRRPPRSRRNTARRLPPTASSRAGRTSSSPPASSPIARASPRSRTRKAISASRNRPRRFHLHRAHRRWPRLGLGRAQPRRRSKFDAKSDIKTAIQKAKGSVDAKALEPGKYTVILEPAASGAPHLRS